MDFFGSQNERKKQSAWLLLCFIAAMLAMALIVHVVVVVVTIPVSASIDFFQPTTSAKLFIALIWLMCCVGCFFRILDVRSGGAALARRFGGVEATGEGRYREENLLLDIVAEIAVASACQKPRVFVLHRENAINAFVVGGFSGNEAIVVTQGAIAQLDRDQLSALVAHEFGHISQGDIPLNMRLLVALGGLNAIDEVGKILMVRQDGQLIAQPGVVVGFVIRGIGSVGVFFGRLISSAFSRQREFLADACAVQFTRNSESVTSLLTAIRDEHHDEAIQSEYAEEMTHLCFQTGEKAKWVARVFSSHPPIQDRIDAIDPHYSIKERSKKRTTVKKKANLYSIGNGVSSMPLSGAEATNVDQLSDSVSILLSDSTACLAVLHAMFVSQDKSKQKLYFSAIGFAYNKKFTDKVRTIRDSMSDELHSHQLAIIDIATAQLRQSVQLDNRQRLLKSLEKLLLVEGELTLMNYATLQLIRRKLDADFPVLEGKIENDENILHSGQAKTFDTMGHEFALLLSLIVESSGSQTQKSDDQFNAALKCYTNDYHPRRSSEEPGIVEELEAAFQTLYVQPRSTREAFVIHCLEIVQADGHIASDELAVLQLFAAALDCQAVAA